MGVRVDALNLPVIFGGVMVRAYLLERRVDGMFPRPDA
jgi:hypothetical protein